MKFKEQTNMYDKLCSIDLIAPIKHMIMRGTFKMEADGKIRLNPVIIPDKPWLHSSHCPNRDCGLWMDIMFRLYTIVPNGCRNCWKLAMKPKTLNELFAVYDYQQSTPENPAKCGVERRGYTNNKGRYGAFWYCDLNGGLKGAREHYKKISKDLSEFLPGHGLILKRGCTEMENETLKSKRGGSEDWDKDAEYYDRSEALIKSMFVDTDMDIFNKLMAPWHVVNHTIRGWIEQAFESGDMTYLDYTGGIPLMPPLNTYHDSKHKHYNYKCTFISRKETHDITSDSQTDDGADNPEFSPASDAGNTDDSRRLSVI